MRDFSELKQNINLLTNDISLLDILIQFERILEDSGVYGYHNWESGEVVAGPEVERFWVEVTLMYPYKLMPEPAGALRLSKIGAKVSYQKDIFKEPIRVIDMDDIEDPITKKAKLSENKVWIVKIRMPKRLIDDAIEDFIDLDNIGLDVDTDDIEDAYMDDMDGVEGTQEDNSEIMDDTGMSDDMQDLPPEF